MLYSDLTKYDLFCFDMDDTLLETEKFHYMAWLHILQKHVGEDYFIELDEYYSIFHSTIEDNITRYLRYMLGFENYLEIIKEKNKLFMEIITQSTPQLMPGVVKLLQYIINNDKKFVIVSNSPKEQLDLYMELFPIFKKCQKYYYREMFSKKKPNPECYKMVVDDFPECKSIIGFEDSITGICALCQVEKITPVFVNSPSYVYYDNIMNYYPILHINNFTVL